MVPRALSLLAGICLVYALPALPQIPVLLPVAVLVPLLVARPRLELLGWCLLGCVLAAVQGRLLLSERLPAALHGSDMRVSGTVVSLPDRDARGGRFVFAPDPARHPRLPRRIRVAWYLDPPLPGAGTRWELTLRLRTPRGFVNPDGFDYERWMLVQRFGASAYVRTAPPPRLLDTPGAGSPARLRGRIDARIAEALGAHPQRGIVRGLVLGERGELDARQWEVFAHTGTSHLVAISGLHIGLVAGFAAWFVRALLRAIAVPVQRARVLAAAAALGAAGLYALLAGLGIPTRRAWWMLAVGLWVLVRNRRPGAMDAWALALAAVLVADPSAVASPGFWLSFGAVFVIIWQFSHRKSVGSKLVVMWRLQLAAGLGLLPLTAWFFQQGAVASPLANLVAVPVFSLLVVPLALLGALLALIWPAAGAAALETAAAAAGLAWAVLERIAGWNWANLFTAQFSWTMLAAGMAGVLWAIAPRGFPLRWAGVVTVLALLHWRPDPPPDGAWQLTVLDVGHGLAAVFQAPAFTLVYDTGPAYGPEHDAASRVLVPYLRARGIRAIDLLVVSHAHDDHQGGTATLRAAMPVHTILSAAPETLSPGAHRCEAGQVFTGGDFAARILHPPAGWTGNANNRSCVLAVDTPHGRVLLPGDVEWKAELELARPGSALGDPGVLLVPHHGSSTSSTPRFVARTRPRIAVISTGYVNRWGFPDAAVVERWEQAGATVMNTAWHGAVVVDGGSGQMPEARAWRRVADTWWRME